MNSTVAQIGHIRLVANGEEGRLDLTMQSDFAPRPSLGLTLMFEDLERFEREIRAVLRATRRRGPAPKRGKAGE